MRDKELALEILQQIKDAVEKTIMRFKPIDKVADFTNSQVGVEKMDAICMMLIVIGEALKKLDKVTGGELLSEYPQVDWKKAKGMRDILTHHYANVNAEAVFYTCKDKIPQLNETIKKMIRELS
jgi:uncharacterized protein with HEPN domain